VLLKYLEMGEGRLTLSLYEIVHMLLRNITLGILLASGSSDSSYKTRLFFSGKHLIPNFSEFTQEPNQCKIEEAGVNIEYR